MMARKMTSIIMLLALLCLFLVVSIEGRKREVSPVDEVSKQVVDDIARLWLEITHKEWMVAKRVRGPDAALVKEYKTFADRIDRVEKLVAIRLEESVLAQLWPWAVMGTKSQTIFGMYGLFKKYLENPDPPLYAKTWRDFANAVLSGSSPTGLLMNETLDEIQELIVEPVEGHHNLFHLIHEEANTNLCNMQQSPQQLLYNLHNSLQLTQLKAYTMIQFSWMLLRIYNKGNFTLEAELMRRSYLEKIAQQGEEIKKVMESAKTEVWRCDPRRHVPEETYTEVTKLLQGFLVNEVDLNKDMSCRENCQFYKLTKQHGCYKDNYCSKQKPCRGNIVGCTFVDSDMWICPSDSGSKRRYDWIEYENGRVLGAKNTCTRAITKVDSWWRWLFWHCSYCMCLCDDPNAWGTDRYFNLRPVLSDIADNKVITGLKFVKENRVIHLQIQQGVLMPKGTIDGKTVEWKDVDSYYLKNAKDGEDYHTLTWDQRAIDFDDLKASRDYVLTGVRFRKLGKHLNLEIQVSKFNFTSGKLVHGGDQSQWISNDNTDASYEKPRKKLKLTSPDLPTRSTSQSIPDSDHDMFMEFESSDMDSDLAQSTVPFIDTQPVAPNPTVPLQGAGIYHKGRLFFGGFIAPKVFTMDYSHLIETTFPEINEMKKIE